MTSVFPGVNHKIVEKCCVYFNESISWNAGIPFHKGITFSLIFEKRFLICCYAFGNDHLAAPSLTFQKHENTLFDSQTGSEMSCI